MEKLEFIHSFNTIFHTDGVRGHPYPLGTCHQHIKLQFAEPAPALDLELTVLPPPALFRRGIALKQDQNVSVVNRVLSLAKVTSCNSDFPFFLRGLKFRARFIA